MGRSAGYLGSVVGVSAMVVDQARVAAWVRRTTEAQDLPEKVTDPVVLREIGVLLGVGAQVPRAHGASAPSTRA